MVSLPAIKQYGLSGTKPPLPELLMTRTTKIFLPGLQYTSGYLISPLRILIGCIANHFSIYIQEISIYNSSQENFCRNIRHGCRYINFPAIPNHTVKILYSLVFPITGNIYCSPLFWNVCRLIPGTVHSFIILFLIAIDRRFSCNTVYIRRVFIFLNGGI